MGRFVLAALLALAAVSAHADPVLVTLDNGTYRAVAPPNWDGTTKLPLVVWLPGYGQDSAQVIGDRDSGLVAAATGAGVLFVVADGLNRAWSHVGAPRRNRDDIAFIHAVVDDAKQRWPVDSSHVIAAGFSIGGSMVWDIACHGAEGFSAFLPFSGAFWHPYPTHCETGPVDLRHVHGTSDQTVPMAGRTLRNGFQQGNVHDAFDILRATDGCAAEPVRMTQEGMLICEAWTRCSSGRHIELCLHTGDHYVRGEWLAQGIAWAMALPPAARRR
jgi:polyhydroxybutyrate depolymerase